MRRRLAVLAEKSFPVEQCSTDRAGWLRNAAPVLRAGAPLPAFLGRRCPRTSLLRLGLALAGLCVMSACGRSGSRETRPVEVLYRVSGPSGTRFRVLPEARPDCGAPGIQAENADHRFGDRVFQAPHLFVLENAFQPVSASFEVPDDEVDSVRVDLFLGTEPRSTTDQPISPGDCATVSTGIPEPQPVGPEARFEICAYVTPPPAGARCGDFPDAHVGFSANVGDPTGAHVTTCVITPVAEACRTPATIFVEEPQDLVSGVISKLTAENPNAVIRVELYLDDVLVDDSAGKDNVKVSKDL